jgi:hypothetical protein
MIITIKKYQELHEISQIETSEEQKASLLIQTMLEMDGDGVKELPEWKYKRICKQINDVFAKFTEDMQVVKPKKYVRIGWKLYRFNYDLAKLPMNTGRYVETATFVSDITNNLHKLLATMATPMRFTWFGLRPKNMNWINHESIANDMLRLNFNTGYQSCVFFCKVLNESMNNSNTYFQTISEDRMMVQHCKINLQKISVGCTMLSFFRNLKV